MGKSAPLIGEIYAIHGRYTADFGVTSGTVKSIG